MPRPTRYPLPDDPPPEARRPAGAPFAWRGGLRWFAAEFLVVVTGVLVALALQAWYEGRRDAGRERAYLAQLEADLRDTERLIDTVDAQNRPSELAAARLVRAFYLPAPPARDVLLGWFTLANRYETATPVTATVEALVTTGDLNLIRSDSLRAAVAAYLDASRRLVASQQTFEYEFLRASDAMDQKIDYAETIPAGTAPGLVDSVARANPLFPVPPGPRRRPFPVDTDAVLRDRDAHFALGQLLSAKRNMKDIRAEMREGARGLRTRVAAERHARAGGTAG